MHPLKVSADNAIREIRCDHGQDTSAAHSRLANELATVTGATLDVVYRLLLALGVDRSIHETTTVLGRPPTITDVVVGYRVSASQGAAGRTQR